MPLHLYRRALRVSEFIPVTNLVIVGAVLWLAVRMEKVSLPPPEGDLRTALRMAAVGLGAAAIWLLLCVAIYATARPRSTHFATSRLVQKSFMFWVPMSLAAAVVEELWRAVCLYTLSGLGRARSVAITSLAFGLAHADSPGHVASTMLIAAWLGVIFLSTQSLVAIVIAHVAINIGMVVLARSWYRFGHSP